MKSVRIDLQIFSRATLYFLTPYVGIAARYIIIIKQVPIATTFSDCASPVTHSSLTRLSLFGMHVYMRV